MVRKNHPNPFANLSDAEIRRLAEQLRDALAPLRDKGGASTTDLGPMPAWLRDADDDHGHEAAAGDRAGGPAKHIRFQHGQMTVLNSARRASSDAAWERLAAFARETQDRRPR